MKINRSEDFQTGTGKTYKFAWVDYYSNFRFYSNGQKYLAQNYSFNIIPDGEGLARFTVAIDETGIVEFERTHQRKLTQEEKSDIAKQQVKEFLICHSNLERNNLAEVRSDLLIRIAQDMGIR